MASACISKRSSTMIFRSLSTGPDAAKTHWWMVLYRTPARIYRAGEIFEMRVEVPELSRHVAGHGGSGLRREHRLSDQMQSRNLAGPRRKLREALPFPGHLMQHRGQPIQIADDKHSTLALDNADPGQAIELAGDRFPMGADA